MSRIIKGEFMKFKPLHDRVLIEVLDSSEKTAGGIIIPDTAQEKPQEGKVIAVGGGAKTEDGKLIPMDVKVGDKVLCENGTFRKVIKTFENKYEGEMIEFSTRFGASKFMVTPNHEFKILSSLHNGNKRCCKTSCGNKHRVKSVEKNHEIIWQNIGDSDEHDYYLSVWPKEYIDIEYIDIPKKYQSSRRKGDTRFKVDDELLWIMGVYAAEGSVRKDFKRMYVNIVRSCAVRFIPNCL